MDFERSTQATCWIFDDVQTLDECRRRAAESVQQQQQQQCSDTDCEDGDDCCSVATACSYVRYSRRDGEQRHGDPRRLLRRNNGTGRRPRVRAFASGYRRKRNSGNAAPCTLSAEPSPTPSAVSADPQPRSDPFELTADDQTTLVWFHAHQLQHLVGPQAIFRELRRTASALSTAIMIYRRFYLSNSVIDFHPRTLAAAAALLAVKIDCEPRLDIGLLAQATDAVQREATRSPLVRNELCSVSVEDIEEAERQLLQGLNYQLRCHHPYKAIRALVAEICRQDSRLSNGRVAKDTVHNERTLCKRALAVAQGALIYSDVPFLYAPGRIAVAAVAMALDGNSRDNDSDVAPVLRRYLRRRFRTKTEAQLRQFLSEIQDVLAMLRDCSRIVQVENCEERTSAMRCAFAVASSIRHEGHRRSVSLTDVRAKRKRRSEYGRRVRSLVAEPCNVFLRGRSSSMTTAMEEHVAVRVTPTQTPCYY